MSNLIKYEELENYLINIYLNDDISVIIDDVNKEDNCISEDLLSELEELINTTFEDAEYNISDGNDSINVIFCEGSVIVLIL